MGVGRVENVGTVKGCDAVVVPENKRILLKGRAKCLGPREVEVECEMLGALDPACLQAVVVGIADVCVYVDSVGAVRGSIRTVVGLFIVRSSLREVFRVGGF